MGQIRKINDVYYIEFYARGLLYSQVAGSDLDAAKKLLDQVEAKIAGGEALTIARYIELVDFYERFLSQAKVIYGPQGIKRFASTVKDLNLFLKAHFPLIHQLDQITPSVIESYKRHLVQSQKPKVVNFTILLVRDILEYGIKLGFINDNPSLHVRLLPWPRSYPRKVTARYQMAAKLLPQGVNLSKFCQLLKLSDAGRIIYFAALIPVSRQDAYH